MSNVRANLSKNKFAHLVENLITYLSSINSHNDTKDEKEICELFDRLQQFIERDFPMSRRYFIVSYFISFKFSELTD